MKQAESRTFLLHAGFLFGLLFNPEDGATYSFEKSVGF
jgi:hypothetical protein